MKPQIVRLVQTIHDSPGRVMIVTAGAGTMALAWLLGVPGASRTLIEAVIPYDESAFNDFFGGTPEQYVSAHTAGILAGKAVARAKYLMPEHPNLIGLACTATLVTDRPKRGLHRAHIVSWAAERIRRYHLVLSKGARDRTGEEELVSLLILNALSDVYGHENRLPLPLIDQDKYECAETNLKNALAKLASSQITYFIVERSGSLAVNKGSSRLILSGSFNPLHQGHIDLAATAMSLTGEQITFELTMVNADKPELSQAETLRRLLQFSGSYQVLVSSAATFVAKARLFPSTTFVVGFDTAERVLQPRFYEDSPAKMYEALDELRHQKCRFLVAGRVNEEGIFRSAADLNVPEGYKDLFQPIPDNRFRNDTSSTALRAKDHLAPPTL